MSTQINDGGPAFPLSPKVGKAHFDDPTAYPGMTLRDYFAVRFAASMVGTPDGCNVISRHAEEDGIRPTERMALVAYDLADAMLRMRQRGANTQVSHDDRHP